MSAKIFILVILLPFISSSSHQSGIFIKPETAKSTRRNVRETGSAVFKPSLGPPSRDEFHVQYETYKNTYMQPSSYETSFLHPHETQSYIQQDVPSLDGEKMIIAEHPGFGDPGSGYDWLSLSKWSRPESGASVFSHVLPAPGSLLSPPGYPYPRPPKRHDGNPHQLHNVVNYGFINVHHGDHYEPHHNDKPETADMKPSLLAKLKELTTTQHPAPEPEGKDVESTKEETTTTTSTTSATNVEEVDAN